MHKFPCKWVSGGQTIGTHWPSTIFCPVGHSPSTTHSLPTRWLPSGHSIGRHSPSTNSSPVPQGFPPPEELPPSSSAHKATAVAAPATAAPAATYFIVSSEPPANAVRPEFAATTSYLCAKSAALSGLTRRIQLCVSSAPKLRIRL